ncbi:hypothetical protein [Dyella sp.]|uniref:hypothetical protein n=1 Tax=Dyella sp. TaxID=1869338 RepID=UPI002B4A68A1|nr:hypothetical protein [Dyella sp.]HKT29205.1 hypothetical protein [Dyella sp.]
MWICIATDKALGSPRPNAGSYRLVTGQSPRTSYGVCHQPRLDRLDRHAYQHGPLVNGDMRDLITTDMSNTINLLVKGSDASMVSNIDENLAYSAIDSGQLALNDPTTVKEGRRQGHQRRPT